MKAIHTNSAAEGSGVSDKQHLRKLHFSIVTVCRNASETIESTLKSVQAQSYPLVEHVLIDGASDDRTIEIIKRYQPAYFVSEPDNGIYYAMQKGCRAASGDIVFFLNSGDTFFDNNVIADVANFFELTGSDAVFGNLFPCYLKSGDTHDHAAFHHGKMLDFSYFNNRRLFYNESVHHQTVFYKKKIFEACGFICNEGPANGEYHLHMCAFVKHGHSLKHIPRPICRFALGGLSTSNFQDEWAKFSKARDFLRAKFFPNGPNLAIFDENEYLYFRPSIQTKLKIWFKKLCNQILFRTMITR